MKISEFIVLILEQRAGQRQQVEEPIIEESENDGM